jgi:hypothetical protein
MTTIALLNMKIVEEKNVADGTLCPCAVEYSGDEDMGVAVSPWTAHDAEYFRHGLNLIY